MNDTVDTAVKLLSDNKLWLCQVIFEGYGPSDVVVEAPSEQAAKKKIEDNIDQYCEDVGMNWTQIEEYIEEIEENEEEYVITF